MKKFSNMIGVASLFIALASAQPADVGFLRIIHAVSHGTGNASIFLNDRNVHPDGYALGQDTGGYGVKAGDMRIAVRREGTVTGTTRIHLKAGETTTIIAYADHSPTLEDGNVPQWKIKFLRLSPQSLENGHRLSFISVCQCETTPIQLSIEGLPNTRTVDAKRLSVTRFDTGRTATGITVLMGNRKLTHISTDSPGNHVVILYEDADGQTQAMSFHDTPFTVAG